MRYSQWGCPLKSKKIRRSAWTYDKLLLSPGASPVRPPLPGIDTKGIFTLRNVADTDAIKAYVKEHGVRHAVIVGGGFIGLEMAENLVHAGARVSVVEMADQVMAPIDYSMAALVHEHLLQKGVGLYLGQAVESFAAADGRVEVRMKSGVCLNTDMVILSIGVRAETKLAQDAGLKLGEMRGLSSARCAAYMWTNTCRRQTRTCTPWAMPSSLPIP